MLFSFVSASVGHVTFPSPTYCQCGSKKECALSAKCDQQRKTPKPCSHVVQQWLASVWRVRTVGKVEGSLTSGGHSGKDSGSRRKMDQEPPYSAQQSCWFDETVQVSSERHCFNQERLWWGVINFFKHIKLCIPLSKHHFLYIPPLEQFLDETVQYFPTVSFKHLHTRPKTIYYRIRLWPCDCHILSSICKQRFRYFLTLNTLMKINSVQMYYNCC